MITNEIGSNAGKIWTLLDEQGEHSVKELKRKLKLTDRDIYLAIGWLSREDKVFQFKKDDNWMMCLND